MKRGWLITKWSIMAVFLLASRATAQIAPPSQPARKPQLWAIIVGVGNPLDPQVRRLSNRDSVQHAFSVLKWFSSTGGWDRNHLLLLTDFGGNDDPGTTVSPAPNITPSKRNLDWAVQTWLASKAQPGDVIVFFFAGQSRAVVSSDPAVSPEYYLVPTDALADSLAARGWALDRALDVLARQGKFRIVSLLATGLQIQQSGNPGKGRPDNPARYARDWLRRLARWPGVTAWLASTRPPVHSTSDPAAPFTAALLEGLGTKGHRQNLAGCLLTLQQNPKLKAGGFQTVGGVPPHLTLWADDIGAAIKHAKPEMVLQVGHADRVHDIVSTADGRLIITASQDSTVRVWSTRQKVLLRVLTGHAVGVTSLGLSRDGRWLVSGGGRGEIFIHDLAHDFARRSVGRQPHDERARVEQIVMLPDGKHFISIDSKAQAFLWDLAQPSLSPRPWLSEVACRQVIRGRRRGAARSAATGLFGSLILRGPAAPRFRSREAVPRRSPSRPTEICSGSGTRTASSWCGTLPTASKWNGSPRRARSSISSSRPPKRWSSATRMAFSSSSSRPAPLWRERMILSCKQASRR